MKPNEVVRIDWHRYGTAAFLRTVPPSPDSGGWTSDGVPGIWETEPSGRHPLFHERALLDELARREQRIKELQTENAQLRPRAEMWQQIEAEAERRLAAKDSRAISISLSLARWVVNAESVTPADKERAKQLIRTDPERCATIERLNSPHAGAPDA